MIGFLRNKCLHCGNEKEREQFLNRYCAACDWKSTYHPHPDPECPCLACQLNPPAAPGLNGAFCVLGIPDGGRSTELQRAR